MTDDFKAELSEIRKNCKNHNGTTTNAECEEGEGEQKEKADVEGKVEALTAAYNDIQAWTSLTKISMI